MHIFSKEPCERCNCQPILADLQSHASNNLISDSVHVPTIGGTALRCQVIHLDIVAACRCKHHAPAARGLCRNAVTLTIASFVVTTATFSLTMIGMKKVVLALGRVSAGVQQRVTRASAGVHMGPRTSNTGRCEAGAAFCSTELILDSCDNGK